MDGSGAYLFRDGRLFEGTWKGAFPLAGAALTADGDVLRAACDGKTLIRVVWEEGGGVQCVFSSR